MGWCTIQSHGSGGTTIRTLLGGETETCLTSRWNRNTSSEAIVVTYLHLSKLSLSSAQSLSHVWLFATPWTAACHSSPSITNSWSLSDSSPLSRWCHPTISSSAISFSSCLQSFSASGSFQMSQFFTSGGQSIGVSASASVLPMNIQDWFPLAWTGWIFLLSKGLSRVFSNTRFKSINSSALSFLYSPTLTSIQWLLEKP